MFEDQQPDSPWPARARPPRRNGIVHAVMIHQQGSETACGLDAETYRVLSPVHTSAHEWSVACQRCRTAMRGNRLFRAEIRARDEEKARDRLAT